MISKAEPMKNTGSGLQDYLAQRIITALAGAGVDMKADIRQDFPAALAFLPLCLGKNHGNTILCAV